MTEEKLGKIYRVVRVVIFAIPAVAVIAGLYLVLFPVDSYNFYPDDLKLSKFVFSKNIGLSQLSFGVFPLRNYRYVDLKVNFKKNERENCQAANAEVLLTKSYEAFLYPAAEPITTEGWLRELLFDGNKTKYPNGSLLHLKPTNEVFLISRGKKILFPGPEILTAFGYSFDNLTDVEQSDIDQFPNADQRVFLWTMPHPDGTVFQSFPSHVFYLVFDGRKYPIENKDILDKAWPGNFTIPVSDYDPKDNLSCRGKSGSDRLSCRFDNLLLPSIGRYYFFTMKYPENCRIESVHPGKSSIRFFSEKSMATVKESLRNIAASTLNRYFYKQYQ